MSELLAGPLALKLRRLGLRLVETENTLALALELLHKHMARSAELWNTDDMEELRALRARFEKRKSIGVLKKKRQGTHP